MFESFWNWIKSLFKKKDVYVPPTKTSPQEGPDSATDSKPVGGGNTSIAPGALYTAGNKIMRDGKPFILRGVNLPDPYVVIDKTWEPDGIGIKAMVSKVKELFPGINVIRLPCMPMSKEEGYSGKEGIAKYGVAAYWDKILKPTINEIRSQLPGCYIIIDYHPKTYDAGLSWTSFTNNCLKFWSAIAPKLAGQDDLILELANEPIKPKSFERLVNEIYQPALNAIRAAGCKQLCLIGSSGWSSDLDQITKENWVKDNNSCAVYHAYANQGKDKWEANAGHALKLGIPVFTTETGFEKGGTEGGTLDDFGIPFTNWMEEKGISYTFWCASTQWGPKLFDAKWNLNSAGKLIQKLVLKNDVCNDEDDAC